jgi:hypothetical protein
MQAERIEIGHIMPIEGRERRRAVRAHNWPRARAQGTSKPQPVSGAECQDGGALGTFTRRDGGVVPARGQRRNWGDVSDVFGTTARFTLKLIRVVAPERGPLSARRSRKIPNQHSKRAERWVDEDLRKRHHITMQLDGLGRLVAERRTPAAGCR